MRRDAIFHCCRGAARRRLSAAGGAAGFGVYSTEQACLAPGGALAEAVNAGIDPSTYPPPTFPPTGCPPQTGSAGSVSAGRVVAGRGRACRLRIGRGAGAESAVWRACKGAWGGQTRAVVSCASITFIPAPTNLQNHQSNCPFTQPGLRPWNDPSTWGGTLPLVRETVAGNDGCAAEGRLAARLQLPQHSARAAAAARPSLMLRPPPPPDLNAMHPTHCLSPDPCKLPPTDRHLPLPSAAVERHHPACQHQSAADSLHVTPRTDV